MFDLFSRSARCGLVQGVQKSGGRHAVGVLLAALTAAVVLPAQGFADTTPAKASAPATGNTSTTAVTATSTTSTAPATAPTTQEDAKKSAGILPVPDYSGSLFERSTLTGDWGGARQVMADKGLRFDIDFTQYFQSVTSGGTSTGNRYGGHVDYVMFADLMRMGLVPGGLVMVRAESRYGKSVNTMTGMVLPVNTMALIPVSATLDESIPIVVTDLNYTQFVSEKLGFTVGKIDTMDVDPNEFASGRGKSQFMNANFIFNPALALRIPYSTLALAALWMPTDTVTVKANAFSTTDSSTTSGFENLGDGTTVNGEVDWQYRLGDLPGGANLGFLYSFDQTFNKIGGKLIFTPGQGLSKETADDTWAVYLSGWQYLFVKDPTAERKPIDLRDGKQDLEGVGIFARFGIADEETNPVEWSLSAGVAGRGLIPSRENDTYGIGYAFNLLQTTRITGIADLSDQTQGVEAYYNIAFTRAVNLTLDAQFQDSALPDTRTAVVLGARLNLSF